MSETNFTDEQALEIFKTAKEVFCNGLYVKVKGAHPCEWDFISFEYCDDDDIKDWLFWGDDISGGIYDNHPYNRMTLKEILQQAEGKYAFEIGQTDW
jgi:hypothetical protein